MRLTLSSAFALVPLAALGIVSGHAAGLAYSEDSPRPDEDTIVVTATRIATDIERLPLSISVIDREAITLQSLSTLSEALSGVPGVSVVQGGPAGSLTSVFVRGANSKHTLALYDGIRLNDPSTATAVFDFGSDSLGDAGRIEVVRGPLSSLYGSAAVGGVINILPRQASGEGVTGFGEIALGEYDTWRALAGVSASGERARGIVTVEGLQTAGFDVVPERMGTAEGLSDAGEISTVSANGSLDLTDQIRLEGLVRHRESETEFDTFSGGPSGFQRGDDADLLSRSDQTLWSLGLSGALEGRTLSARLRTGQVMYDLESFNDAARTDVYTAERDFFQLTGDWRPKADGGLIDPVVSFGLEHERETIATDTAFNDPLSVDENFTSAFGAAQAGLTPNLTLTASARLDDYENFGTQTTGNIGAVYLLAGLNTRLRASYATSFKAPTLSERFASSAFVTPNPDLGPETGTMAEIGFDTTLEWFAFGVVYFDGEIENLIETVFDFTTFTGTNENIAAAELSGVEAHINWQPVSTLRLEAYYTYTDAANAATGSPLLRRPKHAWSARGAWQVSERLGLSAHYVHTGDRADVTYDDDGFFLDVAGETDGFGVLNVSGRYGLSDRLEAFAAITNLTDETYEQPAAFAGAPRSAMVGFRWRPEP